MQMEVCEWRLALRGNTNNKHLIPTEKKPIEYSQSAFYILIKTKFRSWVAFLFYRATPTARFSRITVTRTCPG